MFFQSLKITILLFLASTLYHSFIQENWSNHLSHSQKSIPLRPIVEKLLFLAMLYGGSVIIASILPSGIDFITSRQSQWIILFISINIKNQAFFGVNDRLLF